MKQTVLKGNIVDVIGGTVFPGSVTMVDGKIFSVDPSSGRYDRFIIPGLIDAHIHLESSLLVPSRFAEAAVPHGTTGVVADPHEIANVLGLEGIEYMLQDAKSVPLRFAFTVPSSVPSTPFETAGATFDHTTVSTLLARNEFVGLGEVMNVPGVIGDNPNVLAKIEVAERLGKPIDGHCPGLTGESLDKYISMGISSDHECVSADEAEEKHRKGMLILVREGSSSKNLGDLMPFAKSNPCCLVTDDLRAADLTRGHLDVLLRRAVELGMDPIHALRSVTLWPAQHYGLPGGSIAEGKPADLAIVKDLRKFEVLRVYINGELTADDGRSTFFPQPRSLRLGIIPLNKGSEQFTVKVKPPQGRARVRVIGVRPDQDLSTAEEAELPIMDGEIHADPDQDVLLMAVVNRYLEANPALGFVRGMGLKRGAIASTVAHDSHNIIAVGVDHGSLAVAVNGVAAKGGYYATDGVDIGVSLPLPVAGLMSRDECALVVAAEEELHRFVRELGCSLPAPFMTLSFQSLLVEPELKLGDRGLFDSVNFQFVDAVIGHVAGS
ncbi:MAG: adenine deaminase [Methanomassiliicoccales archaeon]|nr:adenine deaminase [Methanomassiliicoccales archaeon]